MQSTRLERPRIIEWESCKGLQNWGRVEFESRSAQSSVMRLTLTFVAARLVARFFQSRRGDGSSGLAKVMQRRIVGGTLRNFRQVVLEHDVPKAQALVSAEQNQDSRELVSAAERPREGYKSNAND